MDYEVRHEIFYNESEGFTKLNLGSARSPRLLLSLAYALSFNVS